MKLLKEEFLRVGAVADVLGMPSHAVISAADRGLIPYNRHPFNQHRLFKRTDIEAIAEGVKKALQEEAAAL
jgi:DNA-binding transcriptional MerR regulator